LDQAMAASSRTQFAALLESLDAVVRAPTAVAKNTPATLARDSLNSPQFLRFSLVSF